MGSASLVIMSWHYWIDPLKLQPLWELYYASILADALPEAEISVIDLRKTEEEQLQEIENGISTERIIPQRDVYVYWIMKSADAFEAYATVTKLRKLYPKSRHIAGGTHVDNMPEQCAEHFDCILRGMAEYAMITSVRAALAQKTLNAHYQDDPPTPFSEFRHMRRNFIPTDRIVNTKHFQEYGGVPGTGAYFSRGCAFRCNFCVYNIPHKFDFRTPDQIRAEIAYLKSEYGIQGVNLRDEVCIPINRKLAIPYLEAIGDSDIIWRGQSVPMGDEDIVRLAAETGLKEVALGLESVDSDAVLKLANKPSKSIDNNKRYIETLKKHGIRVKVCLIFGLPGESKQVLEKTIAFLEEVQPDYVAVSGFDPVPGSSFFEQPEKWGIRHIDEDLNKHAHLMHRFGDDEDIGLPFEYEHTPPWGEALSRQEISDNIKAIQAYLRERSMSY